MPVATRPPDVQCRDGISRSRGPDSRPGAYIRLREGGSHVESRLEAGTGEYGGIPPTGACSRTSEPAARCRPRRRTARRDRLRKPGIRRDSRLLRWQTVTRLPLPDLLAGHEALAPSDCLSTLRAADSAVEWNHRQGYVIHTMVSPPMLLRENDTLLLVGVTDVSDLLWDTNRTPSGRTRQIAR